MVRGINRKSRTNAEQRRSLQQLDMERRDLYARTNLTAWHTSADGTSKTYTLPSGAFKEGTSVVEILGYNFRKVASTKTDLNYDEYQEIQNSAGRWNAIKLGQSLPSGTPVTIKYASN